MSYFVAITALYLAFQAKGAGDEAVVERQSALQAVASSAPSVRLVFERYSAVYSRLCDCCQRGIGARSTKCHWKWTEKMNFGTVSYKLGVDR